MRRIHIIGGGTFSHVRTHLALAAPAFGQLARQLAVAISEHPIVRDSGEGEYAVHLHLTRMAFNGFEAEIAAADGAGVEYVVEGGKRPTSNEDVQDLVDSLCADDETAMIFLTAAICDFAGQIGDVPSGKTAPRMHSREIDETTAIDLTPADKILTRIRSKQAENPRKDIFLISCKTTDGVADEEMVLRGIASMKAASCNLVLVNDVKHRRNCVVTPEQAAYGWTYDRDSIVKELVDIALHRAQGEFIRTHVVDGTLIPLGNTPHAFEQVVGHAIKAGAYKDIVGNGKTVGHFAYNPGPGVLFSSRRHTFFPGDGGTNLVRVQFTPGLVSAFGAKPSAGARSQMQLFEDHDEYDCVIHFHCPLRPEVETVNRREQRLHECGSINCGINTSQGIQTVQLDGFTIGVVMLDNHGPNILFRGGDDPDEIVRYIEATFDLSRHTGEV